VLPGPPVRAGWTGRATVGPAGAAPPDTAGATENAASEVDVSIRRIISLIR
jgi:hypothetical protein